jgi:hypothetical protein
MAGGVQMCASPRITFWSESIRAAPGFYFLKALVQKIFSCSPGDKRRSDVAKMDPSATDMTVRGRAANMHGR